VSQPVDQSGRVLGPKALQTRERLLEATNTLLDRRSLRDLRVVEIARRVGSSPATFYQYFKDVEEAVLALAEQAGENVPAMVEMIDGPWQGEAGLANARAIVEAFIRHWDENRAVLRVRDLAAEEGDARFRAVRGRALAPIVEAVAAQVARGHDAGRIHPQIHPYAAAAAMAAILERLSAYHTQVEGFGMTRGDLVESCARILVQTLLGSAPE
jgi:AcrR family transcriptional regulator